MTHLLLDGSDKPKGAQLVTADGTYISQSALSVVLVKKEEKMFVNNSS